ncbi:MAG: flagellar motor switch protein FliN [Verrucomicrobiae bacterium]|nr:flagellar motor switch protein FliN [Verrucomicrobiae bacterium]
MSPPNNTPAQPLDMVMDIPVEISVELGTTEMPLRDVMKLASGSVIELNKKSDEPVCLYVNRKLVAKGEVVVVDNNYGIKITNLITDQENPDAAAPAAPPAAAKPA